MEYTSFAQLAQRATQLDKDGALTEAKVLILCVHHPHATYILI